MRIRRYTGRDAQEAMLKVKMDLGSEAIILNTRKVRKRGIKGLFSKPVTEILAAVDNNYGSLKKAPQPPKTNTITEEQKKIDLLENRLKQMEAMLERFCNWRIKYNILRYSPFRCKWYSIYAYYIKLFC
jgi:flagellar biosynthesis protein FlhF